VTLTPRLNVKIKGQVSHCAINNDRLDRFYQSLDNIMKTKMIKKFNLVILTPRLKVKIKDILFQFVIDPKWPDRLRQNIAL